MLASKYRLKTSREFDKVYKKGVHIKGIYGKLVVFKRAPSSTSVKEPVRIGIVVSTKVGSAVARNKMKRRVREVFRQLLSSIPQGYDMTYVVWTADCTYGDIQKDIEGCLRKVR